MDEPLTRALAAKVQMLPAAHFEAKQDHWMLFFVKNISLYFVMICMFLVEGKNLSTVSTSSSCSL